MKGRHISKTNNSAKQFCSNCGHTVNYNPRYPKHICRDCAKLLTDKNGRRLAFYNTHLLGSGCQGYYIDIEPNEKYDFNICFINSKEYFAEEAYLGGIVIQEKGEKKS